ncbi:MAG: JAB domain-containing protein [Oscillospiraceae bacterium]|nr:JAB domain-containing protein [Oscillospiraceae bacterium]
MNGKGEKNLAEKKEKPIKKTENLNKGHRSRMRERYLACGFSGFQEHEILEMLLFYALPRVNTNPIAHCLLNTFHSLSGVMDADITELKKIPGIQDQAAIFLKMMPDLFRCYQLSKEKEEASRIKLDMEQKAFMTMHLRNLYTGINKERAALILLDNDMQIIEQCFISEGSASLVSVNIRNIVEIALKNNAVSVILAHNHPAGSAAPSREDMYVTKQLYNALRYLDITLEDHYILGKDMILSMREHGFWETLL